MYPDNCDYWEDWENWSDETREGIRMYALAEMEALGDWFFWTWKVRLYFPALSLRSPLIGT